MDNVNGNVKSEPKEEQGFYVKNSYPQGFDITRKMVNEELENQSDDYEISSPITNEEWEWITDLEEELNELFYTKITNMIWENGLEDELISDLVMDYFIPQVRKGKDLKDKMVV